MNVDELVCQCALHMLSNIRLILKCIYFLMQSYPSVHPSTFKLKARICFITFWYVASFIGRYLPVH